ncbi:MAG: homoaconitate hydratase [Acidimicrobiia bacterium]
MQTDKAMTCTSTVDPFGAEPSPHKVADSLRLVDCTLRDGEQQAGVVLNKSDKVRIARALDSLGIYEIEAGTPVVSEEDASAIRDIMKADLQARISVLVMARPGDVAAAADLGVWGIRISHPISSIQRRVKMGLSDDEYLDLALRCCEEAKSRGLYVIFSPYDTTRSDLGFLASVLERLHAEGTVDRVRLVDTTGCASPAIIRYLVGFMREKAPFPVEVHCHNDLGLATANTISGALSGAQYLSVTINGIGERAGNTSLEEVAVALKVIYGIDTGLHLDQLMKISALVEELSGSPLQQNKAVVGRGAFWHESGTAVAGVLKDPFTAECYLPELVGQRRQFILGKGSGLSSIRSRLADLGLEAEDPQAREILARVKEESIASKRPVDDDQFRAIVEGVLAKR